MGARLANPYDLDDERAYRRWRDLKLERAPTCADDLGVELRDPGAISAGERGALLAAIERGGVAIYRAPPTSEAGGRDLVARLGAQLGLTRLDANWLADEDGISAIAVGGGDRADFIPYTERAIRWHTDGYYHPPGRRIRSMILHCVRPAARGGANGLLDPELAYIALRDADPAHVAALMQPDAMTIPARLDEAGVARAAQGGPVFEVADGALALRYTARTRSIEWKDDAATAAARTALERLLEGGTPWTLRLRLAPGMGIVGRNVLHDREAFADAAAAPRLVLRARYLDRVGGEPWRNG
ncbi:MAG: TauD/TfdA family dioxygenase [Burkholderiales bacterium]|nr:TauD/TfdA family dioxygenase [Burkholderiales bacterium]